MRAVVLRTFMCENGATRGEHVAHLPWDMQQFYDSVSLPLFVGELIRRGFPIHLFILGFMAHAAPRVLQVGKCLGPPIIDHGNSTLAGCQLSVSMAMGLIWEIV